MAQRGNVLSASQKGPRKVADNDIEREAIQNEGSLGVKGPTYRAPAEIALALASVGLRISTTVSTLNQTTRGGIPNGRRIVLVGPPGCGKTGLVAQEILQQARAGHAAGYLVADGDANDVIIRMGQQLGFDRDMLEAADASTLFSLADQFRSIDTLMVFDAEDGWTVETAAEELHKRAKGKATFLAIDSIQTVRTEYSANATSPKDRIDVVIRTIKMVSHKYGHRVLATSEAGRSAYRYTDAGNRSEDIAAGKESGGIEYAADILLVMRSVKGEDDLFDVSMPKNRLGPKRPFRLKLNFRLATFVEVPLPDDGAEERQKQTTEEERVTRARERVLRAVRSHTDLKSKNEVSRKAGGTKQDNLSAVDDMVEMGTLTKVDGCYRAAETAANGVAS